MAITERNLATGCATIRSLSLVVDLAMAIHMKPCPCLYRLAPSTEVGVRGQNGQRIALRAVKEEFRREKDNAIIHLLPTLEPTASAQSRKSNPFPLLPALSAVAGAVGLTGRIAAPPVDTKD